MIFTYIFILISIYVICRSFVELLQLLLLGDLPRKKILTNYFYGLQGLDKGKKSVVGTLKQKLFPSGENTKLSVWATLFLSLFCVAIGYLFFQNILFAILTGGLGLLYPRVVHKRRKEKHDQAFILQFRDAMLSISSSLKAGSSLQTAFSRCYVDMKKQLDKQKLKPILLELERVNRDFQFGVSVEDTLEKFKERNSYEEVQQFIDGTLITKSKGGNLTEVIENITSMITDKINVQQEIKLATAQKKMEAKILTFFPIVLVVLIMLFNPAYLTPMYQSWVGTSLLFIASLMLIVNYFLAKAITTIEI
ncbi:type II secretion system F family protein [Halalkalibacter alkalisediminis]|uniref:Type II secretion system F family protein n=1 Tax=Halalkalibacter alkalisediminis TaxID=935616 RepID=A0ABV6NKF3_9BACI|nr:type II secretion system F family protein [Halalkalibacter alkalisediminis]